MDFHTLSRKELQALCKKNKIPANITNVAMADALSALPQVEGLDEILNPKEGDVGTPAVQPRTACRNSTQRKPVKEPESIKVYTRVNGSARPGVTAEAEVQQENKDANVPLTPAVLPTSRRRVPAVSTRRKKEVIVLDDDSDEGDKNEVVQEKPMVVAKTPAVAPSSRRRTAAGRSVCDKNEFPDGTSVQKGYSTRRSVRLLGKSLSKISLAETEEVKSVSQQEEDSFVTEKGTSLQTDSTVFQDTEELEVTSLIKAGSESQSQDSGSEVKPTDAEEDVLQAEPEEEGSESVKAAQKDPSLNLQNSFETCVDSNEAGSEQAELEESCDSDEVENKDDQNQAMELAASEDASLEIAVQANAPLTVEEPDDASVDVPNLEDVAGLSVEVSEEVSKEIVLGMSVEACEEAPKEISHQAIASLNVMVPDDACVDDPDEGVVDMSVMVSEEASMEFAEQAIATLTADGAMEISSEEHQVEEQSFAETEKIAEKDETFGISEAENEVCIQSIADDKEINEVEKVIQQLSMLDVAVKKEDQNDNSEKLEAEAQADENAAGAKINESVVSEQIKGIANEIQTVPSIEGCMGGNRTMMKENFKTIAVQDMSLRGLKKKLKELEGKLNKTNKDDVQMHEVENKRTALQALPQNM